jgi:ureidoglycolate hydrolase
MNVSKVTRQLQVHSITSGNFRPYGQVIFPSRDGSQFGAEDAQLLFDRGTPRFYIMQLHCREIKFHQIVRHLRSTQCLGSLEGKEWLIAVCPPNNNVDVPDLKDIAAFQIPGNCFINLNIGTWHAGSYFEDESVNFYSLESTDTNIVDSLTYDFLDSQNLELQFNR